MQIKEFTVEDAPLLAEMNKDSIEDEDPESNLSLPHLEERIRSYIKSEYKAFFFLVDDKIIGFALCSKSSTPVYMRQFFISRDERRKGYGKEAFELLLKHLGIKESDIDVYAWNDSSIRFWKSLGVVLRRNNTLYRS